MNLKTAKADSVIIILDDFNEILWKINKALSCLKMKVKIAPEDLFEKIEEKNI